MKSANQSVPSGAAEEFCSEIEFETTPLFIDSVLECISFLGKIPDGDEVSLPSYEAIQCLHTACENLLRVGQSKFQMHCWCYTDLQIAASKGVCPATRELRCKCIDCLHKALSIKYDLDIIRSRGGKIYLMQNQRNRYVKIGFTRRQPEFREKTLQSEEPEIRLLCTWPGTFEDELHLHRLYAHRRLRGEWFSLTDEELKDLAKMDFGCGIPNVPAWMEELNG